MILLKTAIRTRPLLKLSCHNISYFIELQAFGVDQAGNLVLLSYINAGTHSCSQTNGWQEFKVGKRIRIEKRQIVLPVRERDLDVMMGN